MARTKVQKKEIIEKVKKITEDAKSMVFVHFKRLKVNDMVSFRKALRAEGVGFFVSKKTLAKKALDANSYAGSMPELDGEVGLAYSKDLIAPAREVYTFQKKFKDSIAILGGVFDGKYMAKDEMLTIATIPSQKTLHGMFVNIISSPMRGLVVAMDQIAKKKS